MNEPSLWDRLRRARLIQILLVYLGVSWVVLQIIETLMGLLELPEWVVRLHALEATGETDKALDARQTFLLRREHADPDLELLSEVREAVQRWGG